jgi:hypothetical protein
VGAGLVAETLFSSEGVQYVGDGERFIATAGELCVDESWLNTGIVRYLSGGRCEGRESH